MPLLSVLGQDTQPQITTEGIDISVSVWKIIMNVCVNVTIIVKDFVKSGRLERQI